MSCWIDKCENVLQQIFSKDFTMKGIKIVLGNNYNFFDNKEFLHTKGSAMETKMAPKYSTIALKFLEEKLIFLECKNFFENKLVCI